MIVLSYSVNQKGICSVLSQGSHIQDILVRDTNSHLSKQKSVQAATFSSFNLAKRNGLNNIDLVRIPPILKDNNQEEIIKSASQSTNVDYTDVQRRPFYLCAAYMNMYQDRRVRFSSVNGIETDLIIYTDASVREGLETTVSFSLLDENRDLLMLFALEVGEPRKPDIAEVEAGLIGLKTLKYLTDKSTNTKWYCDNKTAIHAFRDGAFSNPITKYESEVDKMTNANIQYEDVDGSENKLADALCDDVRFDEFDGSLIYCSNSMGRSHLLQKTTEIASDSVSSFNL